MTRIAMHHAHLIALLILFLFLATLYNIAIPLGEGPDESGHMEYVLFLAREGRLPVQGTSAETSDVPGEGHQPPLAYLLALPAILWLPPDVPDFEQTANPHFLWNGGNELAAHMRASHEYWPWRGVVLAWHLTRGISTLLAVGAVVCTWGAARAISASVNPQRRDTIALLAAALVAFNPQFLFTSALVTNDALLTTLSAALLWLCISNHTGSHFASDMHYRMLLAGLVLGLALLTKQNALLLLVLPLWANWRAAWHAQHWSIRRAGLLIGYWSGIALLVAGWWYGRNWQLYGDPLGMEAFRAVFLTQPFEWRSAIAWLAALERLHASFWATFGWISLPAPTLVIWFYTAIEVVALAGLARVLRSRWRARAVWEVVRSPWTVLLVLPLLACAWTVSFALTAGLVAWQGRLLFVALPAVAILLARGIETSGRWIMDSRLRQLLPMVFGVALVAVAAYLPIGAIAPAYQWQTLPPATAEAHLGHPTYARYAKPWQRGAELRGWRLEGAKDTINYPPDAYGRSAVPITAGETVTLILTWHCLERIEHNWTVFIHLVDDEGVIVAESNSIPQHGSFPMPLWTPGDWLQDTHLLVLPADTTPGEYHLRVGLYLPWQRDPQSGRRQDTWAEDGTDIGDYAEIGSLHVR